MRYRLSKVLSLVLILSCLANHTYAKGEAEAIVSAPAVNLQGVNSLFVANEHLYAYCWDGLFRFDEQNENPTAVKVGNENFYATRMTAWDETFFSMDESGVLSSMILSGEQLSMPQTLATLPVAQGEDVYIRCNGLVADESAVWVLLAVSKMESPYDATTLYRVDRADGTVTQVEIQNLIGICEYKNGFLLAHQWDRESPPINGSDSNAPKLVSIDKNSLGAEVFHTLSDWDFYSPAYDAANDLIHLASPSKLIRLNSEFQEQTCAFLSLQYISDGTPSLVHNDRYLIACDDEALGFVSSATDPALMPAKMLKLAMPGMDDVTRAFSREHPDIAVNLMDGSYFDTTTIAQSMVSKSADIDVYSIYLGHDTIRPLRDKGYYVDLSGSETIAGAISRMYPQLTAYCYDSKGKPFALPYNVYTNELGYSPSALKKLGLTTDDLPRTYAQLLDFVVLWAEEYMDNEWNLPLFEWLYDIRQELHSFIAGAYVNSYLQSGEELTFDTPLFRSLMEKLDEVSPSILCLNPETTDGMVYISYREEAPSLLTAGYDIHPREYSYSDYVPLALVLEEQTDPTFTVIEQVLLVNPYSENIDLAILYLEYMAEHMNPCTSISIFPDANEPIENEWYPQWIQNSNERIADIQERLKAADEDHRPAVEEELEEALLNQERINADRWFVSAEQIAAYREQSPFLVVNADNVLSSSNILEITSRYLQGALTADQYVDELEQRLRMMRLEAQ